MYISEPQFHNGSSSLHSGAEPQSTNHEAELTAASAHGTVLAINGSKHWYCIFVPRSGRQHARSQGANTSVDDLYSSGDNNSTSAEEADSLNFSSFFDNNPSEYLSNLSMWFDRVQDGQFPRLYVRQWPGLYVRTPDNFDTEDF